MTEEQPVRVEVGACRCPGSPHPDGDWVELEPVATLDIGQAATMAVHLFGGDAVSLQVELGRAFLRYGIRSWSFTDTRGDPVPVAPRDPGWREELERLLPWSSGGFEVAERADKLYAQEVLRPWMTLPSSSASRAGQTAGSTPAAPATGAKPRTRSAPSSRKRTGGKR